MGFLIRAECVQFFELVGHKQQVAARGVLFNAAGRHICEHQVAGLQGDRELSHLHQAVGLAHGWLEHLQQGQRQGVEGMGARAENGDKPLPATWLRPSPQERQQPSKDDR